MKMLQRPLVRVLSVAALAALLAGCGGVQPENPRTAPAAPPVTVRPAPAPAVEPGPQPTPSQPANQAPPVAPSPRMLSFATLEKGFYSGIDERMVVLITDPTTWAAHWQRHAGTRVPAPPAPAIDFMREAVLAVHMGERMSGGHAVDVTDLGLATDGSLKVSIVQKSPGPAAITTQALTQPYHFIRVPGVTAQAKVDALWK